MPKDLPFDYSEVQDQEDTILNTDDVLGQITTLARELKKLQEEEAKAQLHLKELQRKINTIAETQLPELFESVGQEELKIDGKKMVLTEKVRVSLPKDRRDRGIQWLDEHGHGGSVKRNVVISFDRTQEDKVEALLRLIGKGWPNHAVDRNIHSSTLQSIIATRLSEGEAVDEELFGVFRQKQVKVSTR